MVTHWMLEEVGVLYENRLLDFSRDEQKSAEYLAINPMGCVPALIHGDTTITETAAIVAYLADVFLGYQLTLNTVGLTCAGFSSPRCPLNLRSCGKHLARW